MQSVARPRYFVYILTLDRKGEYPFYVGKGCNRRPHVHGVEARNNALTVKRGVIRYLLECKKSYWIHEAHRTDDEDEAYWLEMQVITSYPRDSLCNVATRRRPIEYSMHVALQASGQGWVGHVEHNATKQEIGYAAHHQRGVLITSLVYQFDRHVVPPYFEKIGYQFLAYP